MVPHVLLVPQTLFEDGTTVLAVNAPVLQGQKGVGWGGHVSSAGGTPQVRQRGDTRLGGWRSDAGGSGVAASRSV